MIGVALLQSFAEDSTKKTRTHLAMATTPSTNEPRFLDWVPPLQGTTEPEHKKILVEPGKVENQTAVPDKSSFSAGA